MAATNYTWRTLVEMTEAWCAQDPRVQKFGYGTITDVEVPRDSSTPTYPYFFFNPQTFQMATGVINCTVNIIVMDLVPQVGFPNPTPNGPDDLSEEGVWKCHSDMTEILRDYIAYWNQVPADVRSQIKVDRNVTITPFIERFTDRVVGVTGTLNIRIDYPLDNCNQPAPLTTTTTTTCAAQTQYMDVQLQSCQTFQIKLYDDGALTQNANALCDYIVSGTAYGDQGTVYSGQQTVASGDHTHTFNLNAVLLPGECVASFTVDGIAFSGCECNPNIIVVY